MTLRTNSGENLIMIKIRKGSTPAPSNLSASGKTYSLSELKSEVLDKGWRPMALITRNKTFKVSTWTELSTKFVEWLTREKLLTKSNLPIYNHAKKKYFINDIDQHKNLILCRYEIQSG